MEGSSCNWEPTGNLLVFSNTVLCQNVPRDEDRCSDFLENYLWVI